MRHNLAHLRHVNRREVRHGTGLVFSLLFRCGLFFCFCIYLSHRRHFKCPYVDAVSAPVPRLRRGSGGDFAAAGRNAGPPTPPLSCRRTGGHRSGVSPLLVLRKGLGCLLLGLQPSARPCERQGLSALYAGMGAACRCAGLFCAAGRRTTHSDDARGHHRCVRGYVFAGLVFYRTGAAAQSLYTEPSLVGQIDSSWRSTVWICSSLAPCFRAKAIA